MSACGISVTLALSLIFFFSDMGTTVLAYLDQKPNAAFISNIQVLLNYTSNKWTQGILI